MVNNNEILNQNESQEKQNQIKNNFDFKLPMQAFIEEKTKWNLWYFKTKSSQISWNEFLEYIKDSKNWYDHNIFSVFKNNRDVYLNHLSYQINSLMLPIYELTSKITKIFLQEYDFNDNEKKSLKNYINQSSQSELSSIYYSQIKRKNFLAKSKILWEKKDEVENKMNQIKKEDEKKIEEIFWINSAFYNKVFEKGPNWEVQIKDWKKDVIDSMFALYNSNSQVTIQNLQYILEEIKDNKDDLKSVISFFLPSISIRTAVKYKLISENSVDRLLMDKMDEYEIPEKNNKKILKALEKEIDRLYIDTNNLDFTNFDLDNDSQDLLQSVVDEFNLSKVESNEILGLQDFKNFCKKVNLWLNVENFRKWNIFKVVSTEDDDWKEKKIQYFYIKNIWEQTIELINITKRNWISASINNPQSIVSQDINKDTVTFQKFFDWLVSLKESWNEIYFEKPSDLKDSKWEEIEKVPEKTDVKTVAELKKALDEIDPKWFSPENINQMAFSFKKWEKELSVFDESFFYVVDSWLDYIKLDNWQTFTWIELSKFLQAFEENKCTRFKKVDNAWEFLKTMASISDDFKDLEFDDKKIVPKWHHHHPWINMFIWKDQNKDWTIQIDKMEDGFVSFSFWKYTEWNKSKNEPNTFKSEKTAKNWSYTDFFMFIKNRKLTPKEEKVEEHHDEEHHGSHMHRHRSLFTEYMGWWSITELLKWAHQLVHTIEHNLETWNKVKAAKAALMFWKFLPLHLRVELQSEVENSEKETMEKVKKELLWVDSSEMIPMIEHILENKSAPQYEIEAAMFAVLKYWSLYPKSLTKYRWSYAWFYALWWTDALIEQITKDSLNNDPDLVVTEEVLVNSLLALQAKWIVPPKRRSKIHKEFWKTIQEWLNWEAWDGEREAWLRMTADWRIKYLMDEFKWGTYAHGIWWMEKVWDKWPDPAWKMNTLPFVIMSTWISMDMHQSLINKLRTYSFTTPYWSLFLVNSKDNVEMYQKYLDKVIELSYWENSAVHKAFQGIWHDVVKAYKFWNEYWERLYPIINMNDWFVVSKMDEDSTGALKFYHGKMKRLYNSDDFSIKRDNITWGHYDVANSPIIQTWALIDNYIVPKDRGYLDDVWKKVLNSAMDYITWVIHNPDIKDEEEKKKIFKEAYKKLERHVYLKMVAYKPKESKEEKDNKEENWYWGYEIYMEMRKKWFDVFDEKISKPDDEKEVKSFNEKKGWYNDFLESERLKFKNKDHFDVKDIIQEEDHVKYSIDDILAPANDNIYKKAA